MLLSFLFDLKKQSGKVGYFKNDFKGFQNGLTGHMPIIRQTACWTLVTDYRDGDYTELRRAALPLVERL